MLVLGLSSCAEPDFLDHQGEGHLLADLNRDWLVINYWATWCAPCIREIPELNELNHRSDVQVVGIDFDGSQGEELSKAVAKLKIDFPVLTADPADRLGYEKPSNIVSHLEKVLSYLSLY